MSHATLIQRLTRRLFVKALARPKLSANAPMTALIAPLAPIMGTIEPGLAAHCSIAEA